MHGKQNKKRKRYKKTGNKIYEGQRVKRTGNGRIEME